MIPIKKAKVQEENKYFGFQNEIKGHIVNLLVKWRYRENRENDQIEHEKVLQRIVAERNDCSVKVWKISKLKIGFKTKSTMQKVNSLFFMNGQ